MNIGIPKEIKNNENRVAATPSVVMGLAQSGHQVCIETGAGLGSGFIDAEYEEAGASIVPTAKDAWSAQLIMKVKEPLESEYQYFRSDMTLFTYLHLAAEEHLTRAMLDSGMTGIAYETIQLPNRSLPLLSPMSEVAGRMSIQIGAQFLTKPMGGKGILLGGVPGVARGNVVIVGAGVAGTNAAKIAVGMGARVTVLDINVDRLRYLDDIFGDKVQTLVSNAFNLTNATKDADLIVSSVLIPGAKAPKLVTEAMVKSMQPGSVIVDIAIDQGGSVETIDQITTHDNPTFEKYGIIHYAVANIPGAVPRTSTMALTNCTLPYALQIANKGAGQACKDNPALMKGVNICMGKITYPAVAEAMNAEYTDAATLL